MQCPDHSRPLAPGAQGFASCALCGGAALEPGELEALGPDLAAQLSVETRADCGAFAKVRSCPRCQSPLTPLRLGQLDAWVERCPSCELHWFERQDLRSAQMLARRQARAAAVQTLSTHERQALASELAAASAGGDVPELSGVHAVLAAIGLPVVSRTRGNRTPFLTWGLCLALVLVWALGLLRDDPQGLVEELGYRSDQPTVLSAFTASFAHFGPLHLLGNAYFLFAFGDGVEQRLPRWLYLGAYLGLGALTMAVEGALAEREVLVAGASGAVAVVMGACVVLQPRARVFVRLPMGRLGRGLGVLPLPIWLYGAFELVYQAVMLSIGAGGVAWAAHLSGLAFGVVLGLAGRRLSVPGLGAASLRSA